MKKKLIAATILGFLLLVGMAFAMLMLTTFHYGCPRYRPKVD